MHEFAAYERDPRDSSTMPTPCFIRAQLGPVIGSLAKSMLKDGLTGLETLSLSGRCSDWFIALSVNLILAMVMETAQYHGFRSGFHAPHDFASKPPVLRAFGPQLPLAPSLSGETWMTIENRGVDHLFKFYATCFGNYHSRLGVESDIPRSTVMSCSTSFGSTASFATSGTELEGHGKHQVTCISNQQGDLGNRFIIGLRDVINNKRSYLESCKQRDFQSIDGQGKDPMWIFDRLVARLLLTGA